MRLSTIFFLVLVCLNAGSSVAMFVFDQQPSHFSHIANNFTLLFAVLWAAMLERRIDIMTGKR